jgi:hypothetical protein
MQMLNHLWKKGEKKHEQQQSSSTVPQPKFHEDYLTGLKNITTMHKAMKSTEHFFCKK